MLRKQKIYILIPTFQPHDAVGNDVLGMYQVLQKDGWPVTVFAQFIHPQHQAIASVVDSDTGLQWNDPDAVLIYHHAIDWDLGEKILARARCKIVIKYHNVTPPRFYSNYAESYYWACVRGIEATGRLAAIPGITVWGDSWFNAEDFIAHGVDRSRCRVIAPLHKVEDLALAPFDSFVVGKYRGAVANFLFVGGIRPNKGHAKALEVLSAYRQLGAPAARLLFVGNYDAQLKLYKDELDEYLRQLDLVLEEDVVFATSVSATQLRSYYMTSTAFLCVSEHEGFCVPLVEAMSFRSPIVAWATTAVGETAGTCGWITNTFSSDTLAEGLAEVVENSELARQFAEQGRGRYEAVFHRNVLDRTLIELVEEVAAQ